MATYELRVRGMTCGSCESIVEQRVGGLEDVDSVDADAGTESVVVDARQGLRDAITNRIRIIGYDVID